MLDGARPEVVAYGFRNPWGWSIDPATRDLWVADVGQLCFEEIAVAPDEGRGANFGWPYLEGAHAFEGPVLGLDGEPEDDAPVDLGEPPDDLVPPVLEYGHSASACGVIGGVVYRGTEVPELDGTYLWADLCERAVHTLRRDGDAWVAGRLGGDVPAGIVAFGQTAAGEVYLVSLNDGVYRVTAP
jgi:glucose/arabinose dehydrogenase